MVWVKICGIRDIETARFVYECGGDAIGLMFAKSSRQITIAQAASITRNMPDNIEKIGVFVNQPRSFIEEAIQECRLDKLQFHGDESPEYCSFFRMSFYKAFRINDGKDLEGIPQYTSDLFLLDTKSAKGYGGSGETFDWKWAVGAKKFGKVILAGGLSPDNIAQAIAKVNPWGVDVSSGVESNGKKDLQKIKSFLSIVRALK